MVSPRQEYREERGRQKSPLVGTFYYEQTQQEQQTHYGAQIDRTGCERLVAPVHRGRLAEAECRLGLYARLYLSLYEYLKVFSFLT